MIHFLFNVPILQTDIRHIDDSRIFNFSFTNKFYNQLNITSRLKCQQSYAVYQLCYRCFKINFSYI